MSILIVVCHTGMRTIRQGAFQESLNIFKPFAQISHRTRTTGIPRERYQWRNNAKTRVSGDDGWQLRAHGHEKHAVSTSKRPQRRQRGDIGWSFRRFEDATSSTIRIRDHGVSFFVYSEWQGQLNWNGNRIPDITSDSERLRNETKWTTRYFFFS